MSSQKGYRTPDKRVSGEDVSRLEQIAISENEILIIARQSAQNHFGGNRQAELFKLGKRIAADRGQSPMRDMRQHVGKAVRSPYSPPKQNAGQSSCVLFYVSKGDRTRKGGECPRKAPVMTFAMRRPKPAENQLLGCPN